MIKKISAALYVLVIVLMATASIIENFEGTPFAHQYCVYIEAKSQKMGYFIAPSFIYRYPWRSFSHTRAVV